MRLQTIRQAIRASGIVLACQLLTTVPAAAAMIGWQYSGTVASNGSHFGGVNIGDPVVMTVLVDTAAPDLYSAGVDPSLEPCGLYAVPHVTVSFGGLVYQSSPATLTVNTPAGAGNCGFGPSRDGFVLVANATGPSPGTLPWRLYLELMQIPVNDGLPAMPPLGAGGLLDLAYGFIPPFGAPLFAMTANLDAAEPIDIPEPAGIALVLTGLAALGLHRRSRR